MSKGLIENGVPYVIKFGDSFQFYAVIMNYCTRRVSSLLVEENKRLFFEPIQGEEIVLTSSDCEHTQVLKNYIENRKEKEKSKPQPCEFSSSDEAQLAATKTVELDFDLGDFLRLNISV